MRGQGWRAAHGQGWEKERVIFYKIQNCLKNLKIKISTFMAS